MTLNSPATITCGFTLALTLFLTPPPLYFLPYEFYFSVVSQKGGNLGIDYAYTLWMNTRVGKRS